MKKSKKILTGNKLYTTDKDMFLFEIGYHILKEFISLIILVAPYFLLGAVFGALFQTYIKPEFVFKYLNKGLFSIINASLLGAILPGCSCTTMPMAEGLKKKGASSGTVASFIMVSPLLSPQTVILTYAVLGLKFTVARIVFSMAGAIIFGIIVNYFDQTKLKDFIIPEKVLDDACNTDSCSCGCETEKTSFLKSLINIIKELGKYFIVGMFIASLLTTLIPKEAIPGYIGASGAFAYIVAVLVGVPLYVCEGEEIPITLALLKLGLGAGPAFSFLLGSVGTCIPTMIMARNIIGKRATLFYIIWWFVFAVGSGLLFNLFF